MEIVVLHHVSLPVSDIERSRLFYKELFGFRELEHPPFSKPAVWFAVGTVSQLHLNEERNATYRQNPDIAVHDRHFALTVSDFALAIEHLKKAGFDPNAVKGDPKRLHITYAAAGFDRAYLLDPDLNIIELNSPLD